MSLETWFISFNKRVDIFHSPLSTSQLELESWGWLKSSAQITPLAFCLQHHFPWMLTFYDQSYFPVFNIIIWNKCSDGRYYWPDFPQSDSPWSYVYCLPCLWLTCVVWSAALPGTNISTTQYQSSHISTHAAARVFFIILQLVDDNWWCLSAASVHCLDPLNTEETLHTVFVV